MKKWVVESELSLFIPNILLGGYVVVSTLYLIIFQPSSGWEKQPHFEAVVAYMMLSGILLITRLFFGTRKMLLLQIAIIPLGLAGFIVLLLLQFLTLNEFGSLVFGPMGW